MLRSDFHYDLPPDLIAQDPRPRGESRLMIVEPRVGPPLIDHARFSEFPSRLGEDDVLVLNDTRVFPARLFARPKGNMKNRIELLLTRRLGDSRWEAWCRPARRVRPGDRLEFSDRLTALVEDRAGETAIVQFLVEGAAAEEDLFWEQIEAIGVAPLPPYIRRETPRGDDVERYQTIYAAKRGAVAAPTAGLHFSREILDAIRQRGVAIVNVTLHVGIGTFAPVKVDDIRQHRMQSEYYEIPDESAAILNRARNEGKRIVAVGTTSVRTLESAVRDGGGSFIGGGRDTSIFITPGFEFRVVDRLLTNFHLPESTLLMLVSAFAGMETVRAAYRAAVSERYRFFSYGDAMFLSARGRW